MTAAEIVRGYLTQLNRAADALAKREGRTRNLIFMEICGTHTMTAFRTGLHSLLPPTIKLLSGPGCPVCVTAQSDIDQLLNLATTPNTTICTYGDMLRVPGSTQNLGGENRKSKIENQKSLESARSQGADIRVIYSTLDTLTYAQNNPTREVILAAVGFETTAPATAAAILQAHSTNLKNFSVLASHKRVLPAMTALLDSGEVHIDGLLCPGHVSAITGSAIFQTLVEKYHLPCVIAGFEETHMAAALATLAEILATGTPQLLNNYKEAVTPHGNPAALALIHEVFQPASVRWRALGEIPASGLTIRNKFAAFDATKKFNLPTLPDREIPNCLCSKVILGAASPKNCPLFATACTPIHPIGPCMVSSEGTCAAHFKYARHLSHTTIRAATVRERQAPSKEGGFHAYVA
ncbi:MAG: hydrogenase formation protein HypD [Phycisphaerales bacterium]|nr:hydrogenase formation protein HypD [Phycisphaerales bacterium]